MALMSAAVSASWTTWPNSSATSSSCASSLPNGFSFGASTTLLVLNISTEARDISWAAAGGGESILRTEFLRCRDSWAFFECEGTRCGSFGVSHDEKVADMGEVTGELFWVSTAGLK